MWQTVCPWGSGKAMREHQGVIAVMSVVKDFVSVLLTLLRVNQSQLRIVACPNPCRQMHLTCKQQHHQTNTAGSSKFQDGTIFCASSSH